MDHVSILEVGPAVVAIVALVRKRFPKLDGLIVVLVACAIGAGLVALTDATGDVRRIVLHGVMLGLTASGVLHSIAYGAGKMAEAQIKAQTIPPPPPVPSFDPIDKPRGFSLLDAMAAAALVGVAAIVLMLSSCALLKPAARTARDVARIACEAWAAGDERPVGMSTADVIRTFCSTEEALRPWLALIAEGNRTASATAAARAPGQLVDAGADQ